jgi:L-ascorbate metabolism protein UlaG (beta-lactamase superfamily)
MAIQYGEVIVSWLGHDGFRVSGSKNIYIDPYQIEPRDKPPADYLLITHSHYDHLSIPDIEHLITPNTTVICPPDCSSKLTKFKMRQLKTMEPGDVFEEDGLRVVAVPAYNIGKKFHPRENDWLGYVLTLDEVVIYHTGDSDFIPEMSEIECNIALLPVSGTYVMDAETAAQAAAAIKPDVVVPMHWGNLIGTLEDVERFKKLWKGKTIILDKD